MIKVENGVCEIKTSEGVPGLTADLAVIVRTLSLFGYYEEAVEVAEQHVDGTEHTYIII